MTHSRIERGSDEATLHYVNAVTEILADIKFNDERLRWIDIYHHEGNKGTAISTLKHELGVSKVLCFGDSDNDLSMFAMADEAYAPLNAKAHIRDLATDVIGHHDKDGVAKFLVERFPL